MVRKTVKCRTDTRPPIDSSALMDELLLEGIKAKDALIKNMIADKTTLGVNLKGKKVIWVTQRLEDTTFLTFEQCLNKGLEAGEIWFVDEDQPLKELWGDDWDDAPAECNAGPPYEDRCRGLIKLRIRLGKPLEEIHENKDG